MAVRISLSGILLACGGKKDHADRNNWWGGLEIKEDNYIDDLDGIERSGVILVIKSNDNSGDVMGVLIEEEDLELLTHALSYAVEQCKKKNRLLEDGS